jgi:Rab GDP dissociation inhibitor
VSVLSNSHQVCAKGKYCAIVSTTVETATPAKETAAGLELLDGKITQFDNIVETFEPLADGSKSRVFISASYDATSHFEKTADEVLALYQRITGEALDLTKTAEVETS